MISIIFFKHATFDICLQQVGKVFLIITFQNSILKNLNGSFNSVSNGLWVDSCMSRFIDKCRCVRVNSMIGCSSVVCMRRIWWFSQKNKVGTLINMRDGITLNFNSKKKSTNKYMPTFFLIPAKKIQKSPCCVSRLIRLIGSRSVTRLGF